VLRDSEQKYEASDKHNIIMEGERDHVSGKEMVKVSREYRKYA
jgi:hypothetical protein